MELLVRSLNSRLDHRRRQNKQTFNLSPPATELDLLDFGSNDSLGLRTSHSARQRFLDDLHANPKFFLGSGGSRTLNGSTRQIMELELSLAEFHGAEEALFFNSGYETNIAIWGKLPHSGDVIIRDEKVHASILHGMRNSHASQINSFTHNNIMSLRHNLEDIYKTCPKIAQGSSMVFIAIESFYSMDGDMSPIKEMLDTAKAILSEKNFVFIVDEAHSTGLIGPGGSGYIRYLGLEKENIIQVHSYAKAAGIIGAVVLCPKPVKEFLANFATSLVYSTGPSFPTIAAIRANVNTMRSPEGDKLRLQLQDRIQLFRKTVLNHPGWQVAKETGVLTIPTLDNTNPVQSSIPIQPLVTKPGRCESLENHFTRHGFRTHSILFPNVKEERIRLMMHANCTPDEVRRLVDVLMEWVRAEAVCACPPLNGPVGCQQDKARL